MDTFARHAAMMEYYNNTTIEDLSGSGFPAFFPSGDFDLDLENDLNTQANTLLVLIQFGLSSFIFVLGVFGNLCVICTLVRVPELRSPSNLFLVNLAISDFAILVISLPVSIISDHLSWPFGEYPCRFAQPLRDVFVSVSIATLMIISLDRYRCIVTPFKQRISKTTAKLIVVLIWLVSYFITGLPVMFITQLVRLYDDFYHCGPVWPKEIFRQAHKALIASCVIVPLLIIAWAYFRIGIAIKQQRRRIVRRLSLTMKCCTSKRQDRILLEKNARTVKMLAIIVVTFWLSMLPFVLFAMLWEYGVVPDTDFMPAYIACLALFYGNSCTNPIILCVMSTEFSDGFSVCLHIKKPKRSRPDMMVYKLQQLKLAQKNNNTSVRRLSNPTPALIPKSETLMTPIANEDSSSDGSL